MWGRRDVGNEPYPPDPPEDPMAVGLKAIADSVTHFALLDSQWNILVSAPINVPPVASGGVITFSDITINMTAP